MSSGIALGHDVEVLARVRRHLDDAWYRPMRSRRTPQEESFWQALDGSRGFVLHGMEVDVRCLGDGPAVLLVHGNGGRGSQFMPLMRTLAAAGLHAVAADLPGFGRQRLPCVTVDDLARVLLRVEPGGARGWHGIVAHSMGNLWALYAATRGLACGRYVAVSGVFEAALCSELFRTAHGLGTAEMEGLHALRRAREGERSVQDQDPARVLERTRLGERALIVQAGADEVIPAAHGRHWADHWRRRWGDSAYVEIGACSHVGVLSSAALGACTTGFLHA